MGVEASVAWARRIELCDFVRVFAAERQPHERVLDCSGSRAWSVTQGIRRRPGEQLRKRRGSTHARAFMALGASTTGNSIGSSPRNGSVSFWTHEVPPIIAEKRHVVVVFTKLGLYGARLAD